MEEVDLILYLLCLTTLFHLNYGYIATKLLLVCMDGFRWDYMDIVDTPNLRRLATIGAKSPYMDGVFPTLTPTSLYSIATGLYVESHGVVGINMYDPMLKQKIIFDDLYNGLNFTEDTTAWYNNTQPIWVTAAEKGLKTGSFYWPGAEARINGYRPEYFINFNPKIDFHFRVDTVIKWFKLYNVDFSILYIPEPDLKAHETGPDSQDTYNMVKKVDRAIGYLFEQLEKFNLSNQVNTIIVSDHGQTNVSQNRTFYLYNHIDASDVKFFGSNGLFPVSGKTEKLYRLLKGKHPNITVYKKEDIPDHYHYKHHRRIAPIYLLPDEGWTIMDTPGVNKHLGSHGFDNRLMSMKPMFMAVGPDIKKNFNCPVIRHIDVYSLMCELLGLTPAPNNGSLNIIGQILIQDGRHREVRQSLFMNSFLLSLFAAIGSLLFAIIVGILMFSIKRSYRDYPLQEDGDSYSALLKNY